MSDPTIKKAKKAKQEVKKKIENLLERYSNEYRVDISDIEVYINEDSVDYYVYNVNVNVKI